MENGMEMDLVKAVRWVDLMFSPEYMELSRRFWETDDVDEQARLHAVLSRAERRAGLVVEGGNDGS